MELRRCLKLRADASFVPIDDGVLLRNQRGSYAVRGKGAYELIRQLFGMLDGRYTLYELCERIPAPLRKAVERQLAALSERGFVRAVRGDDGERLPEWATRLYHEQLEYLADALDDAWSAFLRFRHCRFVCIGSGIVLRSLLRQLAEYGAADVRVVSVDHDDGVPDAMLRELVDRDPLVRLSRSEDIAVVQADCDILLVAFDRFEPEGAQRLFEAASAACLPSGVIMPIGESIVSVPLFVPGSCWECVYRSLVVNSGRGAPAPPRVAAGLACNHLMHEAFLHRAGVEPEAANLAIVDVDSLVVRVRPLSPTHPRCGRHRPAETVSIRAGQDEPIRPDLSRSTDPVLIGEWQNAISDHIIGLVDTDLGPLIAVGEGDLVQSPLSGSRCVARAASSIPHRPATLSVICRGLSARETRNQVVLFAVERLAREVVGESGIEIGAGWSPEEAQYRALVQCSLDWALASFDSRASILPAGPPTDAITAYLVACLSSLEAAPASLACMLTPTGLVVARVSAGSGAVVFGAGLSAEAANANALAVLACAAVPNGFENDHVVPALLTLRQGTWSAALDDAARRRSAPYTFLDASPFLPAFIGKIHIALLRTAAA
jgi:hypothetical protein